MLLQQTVIFVFLSFFSSTNALQCTTNCSFTYSLTTPFAIPDACNQRVTAGKCVASIGFWYNRQQYDVYLRADPSTTILVGDNRRFVLIDFSTIANFYSYTIDIACKNHDDCARDSLTNNANEMLQRQYDYSGIMDEIERLVIGRSLISIDNFLNCYDSNENVYQCGTTTNPGSCVISNEVSEKKISKLCDTDMTVGYAYVSVYQSDDFVLFEVHCNRSLCNTQSTLQQAKDITYKYNITVTPDGRLSGSRFIVSISLMIMTILFLLFNQIY